MYHKASLTLVHPGKVKNVNEFILFSEFYDFEGAEDEAAAGLLARHIEGLVQRARKTKLRNLTHSQQSLQSQNAQVSTSHCTTLITVNI